MRRHRLAALTVVGVAVIAAAALSAASAANRTPASTPAASGSIAIAIGGEPSTLDPLVRDDGNERAVTQSIFETLMGRTPDGKRLYPKLAAAIPTRVSPSAWRFRLRPNIKFTDGEPFNADSVVASVRHVLDPKAKSEQVGYLGSLKGAKKVNNLTVDILTKGTDPILPSRTLRTCMPAFIGGRCSPADWWPILKLANPKSILISRSSATSRKIRCP